MARPAIKQGETGRKLLPESPTTQDIPDETNDCIIVGVDADAGAARPHPPRSCQNGKRSNPGNLTSQEMRPKRPRKATRARKGPGHAAAEPDDAGKPADLPAPAASELDEPESNYLTRLNQEGNPRFQIPLFPYQLDRLVIVIDQFISPERWLEFRASREGFDFNWTIRNMDSVPAQNLRYYEPRETIVEFNAPVNVDETDSFAILSVLRAKQFDVFNILNNMRPRPYTLDQQHLKIHFTGGCRYWSRRLPRIEQKESPFYHEYLLVPLIAHWAWKDATVGFPDDCELWKVDDISGARLDLLRHWNTYECEKGLLRAQMYVAPDMLEAHAPDLLETHREMRRQKQEANIAGYCKDKEDETRKSRHLQSVRGDVYRWQSLFSHWLFKCKAEEVSQLAEHIVRSKLLSDKAAFSSASASLTGPVGMMSYVEDGMNDLPELLLSRKLRDGYVRWAVLYHERNASPDGRARWTAEQEKTETYFKRLRRENKQFQLVYDDWE
ncbi:hypothetical protein QBC44DRAFT_382257 [Cladorrhinum sp. PSN332]|nr:hypothetical protein QBC44DRAFT_382257 [Cladorrhinum sp. PSN332]